MKWKPISHRLRPPICTFDTLMLLSSGNLVYVLVGHENTVLTIGSKFIPGALMWELAIEWGTGSFILALGLPLFSSLCVLLVFLPPVWSVSLGLSVPFGIHQGESPKLHWKASSRWWRGAGDQQCGCELPMPVEKQQLNCLSGMKFHGYTYMFLDRSVTTNVCIQIWPAFIHT